MNTLERSKVNSSLWRIIANSQETGEAAKKIGKPWKSELKDKQLIERQAGEMVVSGQDTLVVL